MDEGRNLMDQEGWKIVKIALAVGFVVAVPTAGCTVQAVRDDAEMASIARTCIENGGDWRGQYTGCVRGNAAARRALRDLLAD